VLPETSALTAEDTVRIAGLAGLTGRSPTIAGWAERFGVNV
jgi:hypothetical protein